MPSHFSMFSSPSGNPVHVETKFMQHVTDGATQSLHVQAIAFHPCRSHCIQSDIDPTTFTNILFHLHDVQYHCYTMVHSFPLPGHLPLVINIRMTKHSNFNIIQINNIPTKINGCLGFQHFHSLNHRRYNKFVYTLCA